MQMRYRSAILHCFSIAVLPIFRLEQLVITLGPKANKVASRRDDDLNFKQENSENKKASLVYLPDWLS